MERPTTTPRRRFRRRPYRALAAALVLCLLLLLRYFLGGPPAPSPAHPLAEGTHRVLRVVDGDTIVVAPGAFVRLIGIDTPETVKPEHPVEPFGPEATRFARAFLAGGTARLSFDRERVDRFGRFLAYVWVGDRLLNEELLRAGLARWEPNFNYSVEMKRRFRQAQDEARRAERGMWSNRADPLKSSSTQRGPDRPRRRSGILHAFPRVAVRRASHIRSPIVEKSSWSKPSPTVITPPRPI